MAKTYKGTPCKYGHSGERYANGQCVECKKQYDRARYWRDRRPTQERNRRWREENADRKAQTRAAWRARNPDYGRRYNAERRSRLQAAQPPWADQEEINRVYANRPEGYHVDHIVPIIHPRVCGLHVPANLQYLPGADNLEKGWRFDPHLVEALTFADARGFGDLM